MPKIKCKVNFPGQIAGNIVYFNDNLSREFYRNKIAIIKLLKSAENVLYLNCAQGILAERGGLSNHGALVARELKMPSFILNNATSFFPNNQFIKIEKYGQVEISGNDQSIQYYQSPEEREIKEGEWIMIRDYVYSPIMMEMREDGFKIIPSFLLDQPIEGEIKIDKRGLWVKNHPDGKTIANKIFRNKEWFENKIKERETINIEVKKYLRGVINRLKNGLIPQEALEELKRIKKLLTRRAPYVSVISYPIDFLEHDFYQLMTSSFTEDIAHTFFEKLFTSRHAKEYVKMREPEHFSSVKKLLFPAKEPYFIDLESEPQRSIEIPHEAKKVIKSLPFDKQQKISRYLELMPIIVDSSEDNQYLSSAYRMVKAKLLEIIASYLISKGELEKVDDIVDYTTSDLEKYF